MAIGDIQLNDKPYRAFIETSRQVDITDFSPRAATPGGSVVHSELGLYQPLSQERWDHGFGFTRFTDEAGYLRTIGNVDTRHDGLAMLYTEATLSATNLDSLEGFTTWNGLLWAWGGGGLYRFDGTTWTNVYDDGVVNFALALGSYLFYCPAGERIRKVDTSDVHTEAGINANSSNYSHLFISGGYVYAAKAGTNQLYFGSAPDLSDLHGDPADDTAEILVGAGGVPILGGVDFYTRKMVFREDGAWEVGQDLISRWMQNYKDERSVTNFRSYTIHNGYLLYSLRDKVIQWNGVRTNDITPRRLTNQFPYITYGRFDNMIQSQDFMYCTARTNEVTYTESLLCYDGVAWFKLLDPIKDGAGSITAMGFDATTNRIWYHIQDGDNGSTYFIQLQELSDFPSGPFPVTGQHSLISSEHDMGFRRVLKSTPSMLIDADNLSDNVRIKVYISLDGGDWLPWATVDRPGITEIVGPGTSRTVEYNYILLRFDFETTDETITPVLKNYTLRFIMRPQVEFAFSHDVILATEVALDGTQQARTAGQILEDLEALRDSAKPFSYIDLHGRQHFVYISSLQVRALEYHLKQSGDLANVEEVATINLVSVKV